MRVLRIFWPQEVLGLERLHDYPASLIIGWKNSASDLVVITTLPYMDPSTVNELLARDVLLTGTKRPALHIYKKYGQNRMIVLGTMNRGNLPTGPTVYTNGNLSGSLRETQSENLRSSFLIDAHFNDTLKYPICMQTSAIKDHFETIQMILFDLPIPYRMQYFSLYPISLELSEKSNLTVISHEFEASLVKERQHKKILADKILQHFTRSEAIKPAGASSSSWKPDNNNASSPRKLDNASSSSSPLNDCISQINCGHELGHTLRKNAAIVFPRIQSRRRRMSMSETVMESAISVHENIWHIASVIWNILVPLTARLMVGLVMAGRIFSEAILRIIEWKPEPFSPYAFKDISATAQQIDLRLQQFCFWPIQYLKIRKRSKDWSSNTDFHIEYIRFYNSLWLVVNDIIIGVTLSRLILDSAAILEELLVHVVDHVLTIELTKTILWLMDWPGGLKLNNELAAFFGELFLWVIQFWGTFLRLFRPYFRLIILTLGYSGFGGATLLISLLSDMISFATLHIYSFYIASARIYHWQLTVLHSLFHLFRGKKHNVLRNRIDSCNYELDQLLTGTIFFTVLIFLLPTVLVFYLTFAAGRLTIILSNALLETCLAFLNHFPLFAILLRFKDSKRLPGGIQFEILDQTNVRPLWYRSFARSLSPSSKTASSTIHTHSDDTLIISYVRLQPIPLGLGKMFHQYQLLTERVRMHYLSFHVISRLLTGQFVPIKRNKLYGLLYSMLPDRRIGISPLWQELQQIVN